MIINWSEGTNTAINAHPVLFTPSGVVGAIIQTLQRIRTATLKVLMARAETLPVSMLRKILIKVLAYRSEPLAVASSRRVTLKLLDERQEGMGL